MEMPWAGYASLRCLGQLCQELYTQVGPLGCSEAAQKGLVVNVFYLCCAGTSNSDANRWPLPCHPLALGMCI